jgi:hypothetical protein
MKYLMALFLLGVILNFSLVESLNLNLSELLLKHKLKNKNSYSKSHINNPNGQIKINLPNVPIYYQNWMRYYHYVNKPGAYISKPKQFFQNNAYFAQKGMKLKKYLEEKDDKGIRVHIPSKAEFYIVVYKSDLSVYSSRNDLVRHQVDSFLLKYINAIPEDKFMQGGVKDLGFISEKVGYCSEISIDVPKNVENIKNKIKEVWIFCQDTEKDNSRFLSMLIKLKLILQRKEFGGVVSQDSLKETEKNKNIANFLNAQKNEVKERDTSVKSPIDGYWTLLQDWTECTLKCGGGKKYQQWQCIPPKEGGKPCQGEAIKTKPCNTQPCPNASTVLQLITKTTAKVARPIIKTGPFSGRLNRYAKCEIKESDAFLTTVDVETKIQSKIPIRLVMNNSTITLYADDSYENLIHSFILEKTNFIRDKEICCFTLKDNLKIIKLCGYQKFCTLQNDKKPSDPLDAPFVKEWENDFKTFKIDCQVGRETTLIQTEDEKVLEESMKKKVSQLRLAMINKKRQQVQEQILVENMPGGQNYKLKVNKAQDVTFKAMEKEMSLEQMLKSEEKQKEEEEISTLISKIEQEKEKAKCLENNIQEKELDEMFTAEQKEADVEVEHMKDDAVKKIKFKRGELMKKLEEMKNKARVRKSQLESELSSVRKQMAGNLLRASKQGDITKCTKGIKDIDFRVEYCDTNFNDDFIQNVDCKRDEDFCNICCETEFGNIHMDKRESCYNMCELAPQQQETRPENTTATEEKKESGHYVWAAKEDGQA